VITNYQKQGFYFRCFYPGTTHDMPDCRGNTVTYDISYCGQTMILR